MVDVEVRLIITMQNNSHSNTPDEDVNPKAKVKKNVFFSRLKRQVLKHVWLVRGVLVAITILLFYLVFLLIGVGIKKSGIEYYFELAKIFISANDTDIKAINGRTNILVLGKGGQGHEAPDLTDTMMVVSVNYETPGVTFLSLPRDIWITELRAKLNSAYYWGNKKQPPAQMASGQEGKGGGLLLAKSTVERLLDEPIQYALVIDFSGFKKIIDIIDGIEVEVEHPFTDEKYPIAGRENDFCNGDPEYRCRYETITFNTGKQYMDGDTALKFVRSRHAEGDEGTDIARSKRQQKVITGIKEKILSTEILLSQVRIEKLLATLEENTETDIEVKAGVVLARNSLEVKNNIRSYILPEDFLVNPSPSPKYDNLYVFIPKYENWKEVQRWVKCIFEGKENCGH